MQMLPHEPCMFASPADASRAGGSFRSTDPLRILMHLLHRSSSLCRLRRSVGIYSSGMRRRAHHVILGEWSLVCTLLPCFVLTPAQVMETHPCTDASCVLASHPASRTGVLCHTPQAHGSRGRGTVVGRSQLQTPIVLATPRRYESRRTPTPCRTCPPRPRATRARRHSSASSPRHDPLASGGPGDGVRRMRRGMTSEAAGFP
jgi:hypothetical protein